MNRAPHRPASLAVTAVLVPLRGSPQPHHVPSRSLRVEGWVAVHGDGAAG